MHPAPRRGEDLRGDRASAPSAPRRRARLAAGIELDGRRTAPARVRVLRASGRQSVVEIVLHEGRKRQVRRMCEAVGHHVLSLHRSAYAGPAARHARARRLAAAAPGRARAAAQRGGASDVAATRLNRYLALAGLGTRRGVEGLVRAGRVSVDGVVALEPSAAVEPGAIVTLDGEPVVAARPGGRARRDSRGGEVPALAHPSELHLAGTSPDGRLAVLLSDERLARRLRALGYDPGRLGGAHPEEGSFRPLDAGELDAARGLARAAQRARARTRDGEPEPPGDVD